MKKNVIYLAVAAVLLIAVTSAFIVLNKTPAAEDTSESSEAVESVYVTGGAESALPVQIDVQNTSGSYSLVPAKDSETGEYIVKGWDDIELDTYNIGGAVSAARAMEIKEIIAENPSSGELKDFGLDVPRASALIAHADGTRAKVLFGDNAPGGEGVYAMLEAGDNTVYLIRSSLAEPFFKPATAYVTLSITTTDPEFTGFEKAVITGENYPEPVIMVRTPENAFDAGGMVFNTHSMTSPVSRGVEYEPLQTLYSIYGLMATNVAAVGTDAETLEKYKLVNPATVISVTGPAGKPEMSFTLNISDETPEGFVYLYKKDSPIIYELTTQLLPFLGYTAFDYMNKMAIMPSIDDVSSVKVITPEKTYAFSLTGKGDELRVTLDGKEMPEQITKPDGSTYTGVSNFKQFYQTLLIAKFDEQTDEEPAENAAPALEIRYEYHGQNRVDTVSFYDGPARKMFVHLNNGEFYLTPSIYVDRVYEDAAKISNGEYVKSYL